jgi:myo-inositol-1-phosphate synthase
MAGKSVKVAVVGVGNCCSALVQSVEYYRQKQSPIYQKVGGYGIGDIQFVAAFDVDERKVGKELSKAIFSEPNNFEEVCKVSESGVEVKMGPPMNGAVGILENVLRVSESKPVDVAEVLKGAGAEVVVSFLPTGADEASGFYASEAVKAGCGFINTSPSPIANGEVYSKQFKGRGLPLIGDDIMSQIGGTIFHKNMLEFLSARGVRLDETYQLDIGGGMETYNTLDYDKRALKRRIKTETIKSSLPYDVDVVAGTTDHVDFMENRRTSYFWLKGSYFLNTPLEVDIYLRTTDAPNSSLIVLNSIRAAKVAMDRGVGGVLNSICVYGYKRPPVGREIPLKDSERGFMEFIEGKRER